MPTRDRNSWKHLCLFSPSPPASPATSPLTWIHSLLTSPYAQTSISLFTSNYFTSSFNLISLQDYLSPYFSSRCFVLAYSSFYQQYCFCSQSLVLRLRMVYSDAFNSFQTQSVLNESFFGSSILYYCCFIQSRNPLCAGLLGTFYGSFNDLAWEEQDCGVFKFFYFSFPDLAKEKFQSQGRGIDHSSFPPAFFFGTTSFLLGGYWVFGLCIIDCLLPPYTGLSSLVQTKLVSKNSFLFSSGIGAEGGGGVGGLSAEFSLLKENFFGLLFTKLGVYSSSRAPSSSKQPISYNPDSWNTIITEPPAKETERSCLIIIMENLRQHCKLKFKSIFTDVKNETNASSFLVITDDITLRLLSNVMKMMEMVNYGISAIQKISLKRKKFHKIDAIYILSEAAGSLPKLLEDYESEEKAQYNFVHIFYTSKISAATMDAIAANTVLLRRVKTFKEFNMEFLPLTPTQYQLNIQERKASLKRWLYNESEEARAIERLITLVTTFPKFHSIEIFYPKTESRIAERIAKGLYNRLSDVVKELMKTDSPSIDRKANKINLFIFDRSFDPASPLIRDYHYAPMLADLKDITRFEVEYSDGKNKPKMLQLDQNDKIYKKYKYTHIGKVLEGVSRDFEEFVQSNSTAKFQKGQTDNLTTGKLAELMKNLPQYTEIKERYSLHTQLIEDLMKIYKQRQLDVVGETEQSIVTGVGSDSKKINEKTFIESLVNVVNKQKSIETKARLLVLALMCLDIKEKDKAYLGELLNSLGNGYGGLYTAAEALTNGKPIKLRQNPPQGNLILDRYIPRVQSTVGEFAANGNKGDLASLRINNDDRGMNQPLGRVRNKIRGDEQEGIELDKIVVFMAGGLGFNEIRCLNKFSNKFSVISGSDCLVSPKQYLEELKAIGSKEQL